MRVKMTNPVRRHYDEHVVRSLLTLGFAGTGDAGVEVHITTTSDNQMRGHAYDGVPSIANVASTTRYLITIGIPRRPDETDYPFSWSYPDLKTAPNVMFTSWQHQFVHVVAHEAAHIRQYRMGMSRSEIKAEKWAQKVTAKVIPPTSANVASAACPSGRRVGDEHSDEILQLRPQCEICGAPSTVVVETREIGPDAAGHVGPVVRTRALCADHAAVLGDYDPDDAA